MSKTTCPHVQIGQCPIWTQGYDILAEETILFNNLKYDSFMTLATSRCILVDNISNLQHTGYIKGAIDIKIFGEYLKIFS